MLELTLPDKEYFSIGEVTKAVGLPAYVLRYWESEFRMLRPARRSSGQRKYIRRDIEMIMKIKDLLHTRRFTIAGAKSFLLSDKKKDPGTVQLEAVLGSQPADPSILQDVRKELEELLVLLQRSPGAV